MKFVIALSILVIAVAVVTTEKYDRENCKGTKRVTSKEHLEVTKKCRKQVHHTLQTQEEKGEALTQQQKKSRSMALILYCTWEEQGIVRPKDGKVDPKAYETSIKNKFPGNVGQELSEALIRDCFVPKILEKMDKNNVTSIEKIANCIHTVWKGVCF